MSSDDRTPVRKRLNRDERRRQLLDVAWQLVGVEGTDALSLGRAESLGHSPAAVFGPGAGCPACYSAARWLWNRPFPHFRAAGLRAAVGPGGASPRPAARPGAARATRSGAGGGRKGRLRG